MYDISVEIKKYQNAFKCMIILNDMISYSYHSMVLEYNKEHWYI